MSNECYYNGTAGVGGGNPVKTQAELVAKINAAEVPAASRYQLTHAEALDRAQLLALFDKLDARGQKTTLAMLAVAVKLHPKA